MPKNLWLKKFDPSDDFTWRKNCGDYTMGTPVDKKIFTGRRLRQLYDARIIAPSDVWNEFVGASSPAADKARVVVDSAPVSDAGDPLDELRAELEAAGVTVDKRWGEKRLTEELEKATAPVMKLPGMPDGAS